MSEQTPIEGGNIIPVAVNTIRVAVETALTRWQEHRRQLEIQTVATNTVIAELTALLNAPPPAPSASNVIPFNAPPEDKP